jgi:hypothetical protein
LKIIYPPVSEIMFVGFAPGFPLFLLLGLAGRELGRLLGGRLSGYAFWSFRVFSLRWTGEAGRLRFRKARAEKGAAAAQCLMRSAAQADFRFVPYLLGGGLVNLGLLGICAAAFVLGFENDILHGLFLSGMLTNGILVLTNLVPLSRRGVPNDGMLLLRALRSRETAQTPRLALQSDGEPPCEPGKVRKRKHKK